MIPRDKALHLLFGLGTLVVGWLTVYFSHKFGLGFALTFLTTITGFGYELAQYLRKEGEPSLLDALYVALPGAVFWVIWENYL